MRSGKRGRGSLSNRLHWFGVDFFFLFPVFVVLLFGVFSSLTFPFFYFYSAEKTLTRKGLKKGGNLSYGDFERL